MKLDSPALASLNECSECFILFYIFFIFGFLQMLEEEVEVPVSAVNDQPKEATKMDTDDTPQDSTAGTDINMQEDKSIPDDSANGTENGAADPEEKPARMETDAKVCSSIPLLVIAVVG